MQFTQHVSNNMVLGAPKDWKPGDIKCGALPVTKTKIADMDVMFSFWRPSAEELAQLNAGGLIKVGIVGAKHPAVAIGIEP